jgi:hypothetical protein
MHLAVHHAGLASYDILFKNREEIKKKQIIDIQ